MTEIIRCSDVGISFVTRRKKRLKVREMIVSGTTRQQAEVFWALRHIDLSISAGESVGLIGRNGCGKSTLLRILAGVMLPDEGEVRVDGGIGAMLELSAGFNSELTGRDNVYLVAALHGFSRDEVDEVYDDIVEWCELGKFMDSSVRHYSSGMKSRLGFALITQLNEPILLIDEALAVGDRSFRRKSAAVMREQLTEGRTVLMVSHNENELERFCQRGVYLRDGNIAFDGPMSEALAAYRADSDTESEASEAKAKRPKQMKRIARKERKERKAQERREAREARLAAQPLASKRNIPVSAATPEQASKTNEDGLAALDRVVSRVAPAAAPVDSGGSSSGRSGDRVETEVEHRG